VRRFQGRSDIPLDDEGRAQARALAAHLAPEHFDLALASDLSRAWETAQAIGAACGISVIREPRLREMALGSWEGLTWPEIVARTPGLSPEHEMSPKEYKPDGGESFDDMRARVAPVLDEIAAALPVDGRALAVSHAGLMHALVSVALAPDDESARGLRFVPAGILRLQGDGKSAWTIATVNETAAP
jgi:broad specificity phosphatase PhoE